MKGLDTPVLLGLLHGSPAARQLIRSLGGEELATTEWNLYELEVIARSDRSPGMAKRLAALEKLRRRITVLPIDRHAVRAAMGATTGLLSGVDSYPVELVLGTLEASGATEWVTIRTWARTAHRGRCKVRVFDPKEPK